MEISNETTYREEEIEQVEEWEWKRPFVPYNLLTSKENVINKTMWEEKHIESQNY